MARLPRLALPGHAHWLVQEGHQALKVFVDEVDRSTYLAAVQEAARTLHVQVHAYALGESTAHLLVTPAQAPALGTLMQAVGRRFVGAHHRRHGGSGTLWNGRFRCAVVQPGDTLLEVLCLIDGGAGEAAHTSQAQRSSGDTVSWLVDPPAYWALGNTPFERQARWRQRLADGLAEARVQALLKAARGGWVVGSAAFSQELAASLSRPLAPRPPGRPRKAPG